VGYGNTAGMDEIMGVDVQVMGPPPVPTSAIYPFANETMVHPSLAPNPDTGDLEDDDVDSLDAVADAAMCPYWYFSPDAEASLGLDPGGIYEVIPGGFVQIIDELHLGVIEDTDIDAFEFVWAELPEQPGVQVFAVLFSVDEDDPATPGVDESGGLPPMEIFISGLNGMFHPYTDPLWDDVDAITCWPESFNPVPPPCPGDSNCDGVVNWRDIDFFVAAMNDNVAAWTAMFAPGAPTCPFSNNDVNLDGTVNWRDIDPLVAVMNTVCH